MNYTYRTTVSSSNKWKVVNSKQIYLLVEIYCQSTPHGTFPFPFPLSIPSPSPGHLTILTFIVYVCPIFLILIEYNKSHGGSTKEKAKKYFSEIDIDTAKQLYDLYKVDFEMFDYSPDEYFKFTRKS